MNPNISTNPVEFWAIGEQIVSQKGTFIACSGFIFGLWLNNDFHYSSLPGSSGTALEIRSLIKGGDFKFLSLQILMKLPEPTHIPLKQVYYDNGNHLYCYYVHFVGRGPFDTGIVWI
jgi:hypothetical protein